MTDPISRLPLVSDAQRERVVALLQSLLQRAERGEIEDVVVMAVRRAKSGQHRVYTEETFTDGVEVLGLLEVAKHAVLEGMMDK